MKYLGIDYGESKIGLAIGDDESRMALPYKIIKNSGWTKLFVELADLAKAESIATIVVGLPINTVGRPSAQTEHVKKFAAELKNKITDAAVVLHDEKFSSQEAKKLGAGSRDFRSDRRDDDVAAMIMLQSYLDLPR